MTTASVIGGDHESSLKLRREPDSKDRYAEWAESNNKVINSAVIELTVHTLPKLIHDCGVAKWEEEDMDHALKHFTQSVGPQEIAVYGYLYTSEFNGGNYIDVQMWGAVSDFNMGSIDGGESKSAQPLVKSLFANNAGIAPMAKDHRYTGHVKIYGKTGQEFGVGIWHQYSSKGVRLCLFPPTGPINIYFERDATWNSIKIPDLLASGDYISNA
ncbi:hypothetical protein ACN42_g10451 [Penicillium freii]|uniref:Uncharacterized protein n=1 Tax=Penicillium freii TaxID=48697 RepID=A0A101MA13_PENFR|nr:hypothetical protein ACN42_g10451 [Penicillium freii]